MYINYTFSPSTTSSFLDCMTVSLDLEYAGADRDASMMVFKRLSMERGSSNTPAAMSALS